MQIQLINISGKGVYQFTRQILDTAISIVRIGSIIFAARPYAQRSDQYECEVATFDWRLLG